MSAGGHEAQGFHIAVCDAAAAGAQHAPGEGPEPVVLGSPPEPAAEYDIGSGEVPVTSRLEQQMTLPGTAPVGGVSLRLLWPQWQGAGLSSVAELAAEFPLDVARRGYAVGSAVLQAVLPAHDGPTVTVPVIMSDEGLAERDGVEAKTVVRDQLAAALEVIGQHDPARIATLGR